MALSHQSLGSVQSSLDCISSALDALQSVLTTARQTGMWQHLDWEQVGAQVRQLGEQCTQMADTITLHQAGPGPQDPHLN